MVPEYRTAVFDTEHALFHYYPVANPGAFLKVLAGINSTYSHVAYPIWSRGLM